MIESPLHLLLHPDAILRTEAMPVTAFDDELKWIVAEMSRLRELHSGIGLAAPQVGKSLRLFVCHTSEDENESDEVFVNPRILESSDQLDWDDEGCLSLPNIRGDVRRPVYVRMEAFDVNGQRFEVESDEYDARVWQHEFDHLNGVLIIEKMRPLHRLRNRRALKALEAAYAQEG